MLEQNKNCHLRSIGAQCLPDTHYILKKSGPYSRIPASLNDAKWVCGLRLKKASECSSQARPFGVTETWSKPTPQVLNNTAGNYEDQLSLRPENRRYQPRNTIEIRFIGIHYNMKGTKSKRGLSQNRNPPKKSTTAWFYNSKMCPSKKEAWNITKYHVGYVLII